MEKESPPLDVVTSDGVLAMIAGSETTATALTKTFRYLLRHPETYEKLQGEIDKFYPLGENALDPKHHKDMYYLDGIM